MDLRSICFNFHKFNERKKYLETAGFLLDEHKMNIVRDRSKSIENQISCCLDFYSMLQQKQYVKEIIPSDTQMS